MNTTALRLCAVWLLAMGLAACSRTASKLSSPCPQGDLAIYLTAEPMDGADILHTDLSSVKLEKQPVIASGEIIAFISETREIRLAPAAIQRLSGLKVPMDGRGFIACAGGEPLFRGALWSYLSSLCYESITIMVPLNEMQTVHMESGCPAPQSEAWYDPLLDPHVLEVLEGEGKLK